MLKHQAEALLSKVTSESICIYKIWTAWVCALHLCLPGRLCGDLHQTILILRPLNIILLQHAPEQAVAQVLLP